jgi:hypothetical protein
MIYNDEDQVYQFLASALATTFLKDPLFVLYYLWYMSAGSVVLVLLDY